MITSIKGLIQEITGHSVIVNIGGLGIEVFVLKKILENLEKGRLINLLTYFHIKEDALELYGFANADELRFFRLLISVSGIGPRAAMTLLESSSFEILQGAIVSQDISLLTKTAGIGIKRAQRLILELKDKVSNLNNNKEGLRQGDGEVFDALINLGYLKKDVLEALKQLPRDLEGAEARIKAVLKSLAKS